ncbi:chymotrypsin-elastase inhibitor ixodidin [Drosophila obscura]|uniref:chymotrypsin-elastase inhibitor ixodidin n=1 Tax=Drosophila obscura TaxID=7282 RepID=UPI001BB18717|nr:chymotrypsin-elastase inhibitor ixodidin [Drosophila obscura]
MMSVRWNHLCLGLLLILCSLLALTTAQVPITPRECPANESYLPCGPSCQTECATLGQPCLIRHIRCPDGCYCNDGYARNARGACIPQKQCRK